jgi:hypothetical protein
MRIRLHNSEKGRYVQYHAADWEIMNLGKCWRLRMARKKVPGWLWDYGLVYEGELVLTRMSRGRDGRTGYEEVTGNTPNISKWLDFLSQDFEFYDLVWWIDRPTKPSFTTNT